MNLVDGIYRKLKKNDFIHSVAILVSGTVLSQTAIVVLAPLLTRLYTPEDFGVLSIYLAIMLTVSIITSLHYDTAIPLPNNEKDALNVLALSLFILLANMLIAIITLVLFNDLIISFIKNESHHIMLKYLPFSIFCFGLFQIFQYWLLRKENYTQLTKGRVRMNLSQIFAQAGLGMLIKSQGLMIGEVIGRMVGGGGMALTSWKEIRKQRTLIGWEHMWRMAVRYRRFPLVASWSSMLGGLTQHLPVLFIAFALGTKAAGWYLLANRILALPDALLGNSVKQVYLAKSAKVVHASFTDFVALFWNTVKQMGLISLVVYIPMIVLSPIFFPIVFGEGWENAGLFVQCMSIFFICHLIVGPISATFIILEEQFFEALCQFLKAVILVFGMAVAYFSFHHAWQIVLCISLAQAIGSVTFGFFSWYVIARRHKKSEIAGGAHYEYIYPKS